MAFDDTATVSGSVVSFSNGADDVPTKSLVVTIPPTLSGVSSVSETQTGRNLFNYEAVKAFNANVIITRSDGDYTMQNNNSYAVGAFHGIQFHLKPATYSLSLGEAITVPIRIYKNGSWFNNGINAGNTSCTFTVTEEADYNFSCNVAANSSLTIKKCQFEVGSAATAYEPYQTPTQYTASLGRTIYGGTADIIKGEGKELYTRVKISDLSWSIQTVSGRSAFVSGKVTGLPTTSLKNVLCDVLTYDGEKTIGGMTDKTLVTWTNTFRVYDTDCEDVTEFLSTYGNGYIVYQLIESAQTDFTFTGQEVPTRLGYNAFWSEQGNTELTYYKSGYGFTSVTVHKETPDGEPVEQTAKFHRIVYGGQADVIRGTCEPKNLFDVGTKKSDYSNTDQRLVSVENGVITMKIIASGSTYTYRLQNINYVGAVTISATGSVGYSRFFVRFRNADDTSWLSNNDVTISESGWTYNQYYQGWFCQNSKVNASKSITIPSCLYWQLGVGFSSTNVGNEETLSNIMIEKGFTASEYVPHFEPFSFPPISMETDEGENTLFANEGTSAITYRKETE